MTFTGYEKTYTIEYKLHTGYKFGKRTDLSVRFLLPVCPDPEGQINA